MNYVQLLFPDFSLILCGYLLCRLTPLNRSVWEPVEQLVYFVFFPVLLFYSIVRTPLDLRAASHLLGAGAALAFAGIAMAYALPPHLPGLRRYMPTRLHAAGAQVRRFASTRSFIGLALVERAAGPWPQGGLVCNCWRCSLAFACRCTTWLRSGPWHATPSAAW